MVIFSVIFHAGRFILAHAHNINEVKNVKYEKCRSYSVLFFLLQSGFESKVFLPPTHKYPRFKIFICFLGLWSGSGCLFRNSIVAIFYRALRGESTKMVSYHLNTLSKKKLGAKGNCGNKDNWFCFVLF